MRWLTYKEIRSQNWYQAVAHRVLQRDVHAHVVGEHTVAQCFDRLIVIHHLSSFHIPGADIISELIVLPFTQVHALHGESAEFFAIIADSSVLGNLHTREFFQYVLQGVVSVGGITSQILDDGIFSL